MTTAPDGGGLTEAERCAELAEKFRRAAERCCQCTDGHHDWIPDYPYGTDGDVRMTRDLAREVAALLAARSTAPDTEAIAAALEAAADAVGQAATGIGRCSTGCHVADARLVRLRAAAIREGSDT